MQTANALSLFFAAGAFGGLVNSLVVWICGELGVTPALGVAIAPDLTPVCVLVFSAVWGVAASWWLRGTKG